MENQVPDTCVTKDALVQWPLSSPYYDPSTMRSSLLRALNQDLLYDGYHLDVLGLKKDVICKFH
jgi:hypothetical protein